jgi:sugar lactone lactonase YvrE/predicted small lipoprotein YifL
MNDALCRTTTLRALVTIILLLALALTSGCAAKAPAYLPAEAKAQLGTVGLASARFTPRFEFQTPAKGAFAGAGRRSVKWAGKAGGSIGNIPCYGYGCFGVLAVLVMATVGGAVAGGISGAVGALPAATVKEAEAALTRSLSELRPQEEVRDRVFRVARQKAVHTVVILADHGPSSPGESTTYDPVASRGIDSILEIAVLTVGLAGDWDINPPLRLVISGRTRLVRVRDGAEIHVAPLQYSSEARPFTQWAAHEAKLYREEFDHALNNLAEQVVWEYFLLRPQELDFPSGVAVDATGSLFIADTRNHRIRKVDAATGLITTVVGTGEFGSAGDGGAAASAELGGPAGIAVDATGNLFIADQPNRRIRKVEAAAGVIATVAGTGESGFAGDGGPATSAEFGGPAGIAVDGTGNLFIADQGDHRIRKVEVATGVITTVAGTGESGFAGDGGPASSAQFRSPAGIAVDGTGNLFIADQGNHRIRKVEAATGLITTVVGTGEFGFAGDAGPATFAPLANPAGIAVDATGNLFIADQGNHRIRKVEAATGLITTVAGTGESGFAGDGGPAPSAPLASPAGIAVDATGNLFIADQGNHRIRKVDAATGLITTVAGEGEPGENVREGSPATTPFPTAPEGGVHEPSQAP